MLARNDRFAYSPLPERPQFDWPGGKRLAVYFALNIEHFGFGDGTGIDFDRPTPPPNHRSWMWREYGNRIGAFRIRDLFEELGLPLALVANGAIYDHAPAVMEAFRARGDEVIGHGMTNTKRPVDMSEEEQLADIAEATDLITEQEGRPPKGWLTPYLAPSPKTWDYVKQAGYEYILDWICDDQPFWGMTTEGPILSIPYPLELNDQPVLISRHARTVEFAEAVEMSFDQQLAWSANQSLVFSVSLHSFIMGRPNRLPYLRRMLEHVLRYRDHIWFTLPGAIADHYRALPEDQQLRAYPQPG